MFGSTVRLMGFAVRHRGVHRIHPGVWRPALSRCAFVLSLAPVLAGCYVYTPVAGSVAPTTYVALDITDRGRVGLGDQIGPAARRVEGVVKAETDSVFSLSVASVGYLNGQSNRWSGEPLTVRKDFITNVRERRFSRSRTIMASGSVVGGILVFALTRGLFGFGGSDDRGPGDGPDPNDL